MNPITNNTATYTPLKPAVINTQNPQTQDLSDHAKHTIANALTASAKGMIPVYASGVLTLKAY